MTTSKAIESSSAHDQGSDKWLQVTPGERLRIRLSSAQTMGPIRSLRSSQILTMARHFTVHTGEEEHFIVLDGTLDIAVGDRRWEAAAGSCVSVRRGEAHAWCNPSDTPLRMLVVFSPGHIEGLLRAAAGVADVDRIAAIAARYGTELTGPPLHERVHSIYSPRTYSGL